MPNLTTREGATVSETRKGAVQGVAGAGAVKAIEWGAPIVLTALGTLWAWWKGLVFPWTVVVGLGAVLVLALIGNLIASMLVKLSKPSAAAPAVLLPEVVGGKAEVAPDHSECERIIRNLESKVGRLQRTDEKQGIQISARDGQIEQLRAELANLGWVREIALWQSTCVERYISTNCRIIDHSLIEEPLFIDFLFSLESSSVYTLTATGVNGLVRMSNRRLGAALPNNYPPRINSNEARDIAIGGTGYLTITQPLTRADAVSILNGGGNFIFDGLVIEFETTPSIERDVKLSPNDSVSNKELREKYPRLDIQFKRAVYFYVIDRRLDDSPVNDYDYGITLDVTIENNRKTKIDIESVQVSLVSPVRPSIQLQPDIGEIYERRSIDKAGNVVKGKQLKNLATFPLSIIGRGKVSGCFQFSLEGVAIDGLKDSTASLILMDKYGEHHVGNHDLTPIS
jgi:hypothetical protein